MARGRRVVRRRLPAAERKSIEQIAVDVGQGVYTLVIELGGRREQLPLPVVLQAPIQYAAEVLAATQRERLGIPEEQLDDLMLYFLKGLQEQAIRYLSDFERGAFETWLGEVRAARRQVLGSGAVGD